METSSRSTVELTFAQTIPALNMKIVTPRETLVFKNIRIAYPLNLFFPMSAVRNNAVLGVSQVTSGSVLPSGSTVSKMCRVNANTHSLIQFNGKTIALPEKELDVRKALKALYFQLEQFRRKVSKGSSHGRESLACWTSRRSWDVSGRLWRTSCPS